MVFLSIHLEWIIVYRHLYFSKVHITPLCFDKISTIVPISTNWMKFRKYFYFMWKGEKRKYHSVFILPLALIEEAHTWSSKSGATKHLPQELHSASWHQAAIALSCVCEHVSFSLISSVHLLASYVVRYQKSLRKVIFGVWEHWKKLPYKFFAL